MRQLTELLHMPEVTCPMELCKPTYVWKPNLHIGTKHAVSCTLCLLVDIGRKVVSEKEQIRAAEAAAWEQAEPSVPSATEVVSFFPLSSDLHEPDNHTLGEGFSILYNWLTELVNDATAEPMWLSSYQVFAHFQLATGHLGFHYNRKTKLYEPLQDLIQHKEFDFIRAAGWFFAMLKNFARINDLPCTIQPRMPQGHIFKCWQRCILMRASPNTFQFRTSTHMQNMDMEVWTGALFTSPV